ncbi:MAG TPA: SpoIIE family protein phosphatase [Anaerolineales bacterium]|nr:SpoIIE family protein phosphatase [Anaerolineales bacterium]
MLRQILTRHHSQIKSIAEAWLSSGASYFAIIESGAPLFEFRSRRTGEIDQPLQVYRSPLDLSTSIELRLPPFAIPAAEARLRAEADLLVQIVRLATSVDGLTTELIDTQDQLLAIYNLTQRTRNYIDLDKLLKQLARETCELLKADSAFIIFGQGENYSSEHYPGQILESMYVDLAFRAVRQYGQTYLSSEELRTKALVNFMLVPIEIRGQISAALGFTKKTSDFMSPDLKLAQALSEHAGAQIDNVLLYQKNLEQLRLQTEMELARQVQLNLLPHKPPQIQGLDLWAASRPALRVGGDFFDFFLKTGPLTFTVGDISGKGLPAAILMSMTRTIIRSKANDIPTPTPKQIVSRANDELYDDFTEVNMFATVFVGQYDPNTRGLTYANAGHSPVIYRASNTNAQLLEADGTAVGVLPTSFSQDHALSFAPDDLLILGTDGLNETQNEKQEMFGYSRLLEIINAVAHLSAEKIGTALFEAVTHFSGTQPQFDDQTLMIIKGV